MPEGCRERREVGDRRRGGRRRSLPLPLLPVKVGRGMRLPWAPWGVEKGPAWARASRGNLDRDDGDRVTTRSSGSLAGASARGGGAPPDRSYPLGGRPVTGSDRASGSRW